LKLFFHFIKSGSGLSRDSYLERSSGALQHILHLNEIRVADNLLVNAFESVAHAKTRRLDEPAGDHFADDTPAPDALIFDDEPERARIRDDARNKNWR
jgi:hypothetical protein